MFRRLAPIFSVVAAAVAEILQVGRSFEHYPGVGTGFPLRQTRGICGHGSTRLKPALGRELGVAFGAVV
jgi:hypothetical protein